MGTKYSSNAASGYNATPPADDGTVSEANKTKWSTIKTKLADPVKDLADTINSELATHFNNGPVAITSNTTLGATHYNQVIQVSGAAVTLTLTDATTLTAGWYCDIVSTDASNSVTLARATAADMINEVSSDITILPLQALRVVVNAAANGFLVDVKPRHSKDFKIANDITMSAASIIEAEGAAVASAATTEIWATDGNTRHITGTTTITSLGTASQAGQWQKIIFDGALTLTHGANLNLPGSANITTAADDFAWVYADTTTQHDVLYFKKDGTAVVVNDTNEDYIYIREEQTSGTNGGDFTTGAWRTRVLNTEVSDAGGHATLSANQITLAAGTYRFRARSPAYLVNMHKCRLQNVTDASTVSVGSNSRAVSAANNHMVDSWVMGRFTIASSKAFELQAYCETTGTNGFGIAASFGVVEVYGEIEFWKEV